MVAVFLGWRSFCTAEMAKGLWDTFLFRDITVFVHPHVDTFLQSAGLTLISVSLVNCAGSISSLTSKPVTDENCLRKYCIPLTCR